MRGTLRRNLDPFGQHDDATLNDALRSAGWFSVQQSPVDGSVALDAEIADGGSNLSVGQRQIIALARAIRITINDSPRQTIIEDLIRSALNARPWMLVYNDLKDSEERIPKIAARGLLNIVLKRSSEPDFACKGRDRKQVNVQL